jgi:hypothetical protein
MKNYCIDANSIPKIGLFFKLLGIIPLVITVVLYACFIWKFE